MKSRYSRKFAVVAVSVFLPGAALAADKPVATSRDVATAPAPAASGSMAPNTTPYSDRTQIKQWSSEKEQLENALKAGIGKDRMFVRQELARHGYRITAVNRDQPDALEYEVVKGANSYEVQLDFENNGALKKVDVATNLWRAESTKMALKDANYKYEYPKTVDPRAATYSDRARMKAWTSEKEQLEKALPVGQPKDFYRAEIAKRGFRITAVNEDKPDYVEYEIVKGDNSYEVQVDFDKATGKSKEVDVTTNMWEREATDRATDRNEARVAK
jgi:hypothetical protein